MNSTSSDQLQPAHAGLASCPPRRRLANRLTSTVLPTCRRLTIAIAIASPRNTLPIIFQPSRFPETNTLRTSRSILLKLLRRSYRAIMVSADQHRRPQTVTRGSRFNSLPHMLARLIRAIASADRAPCLYAPFFLPEGAPPRAPCMRQTR